MTPITQLKRDWKNGEIKLLFFTLFFAVSSISFINLFSYRLDQGIYYQGGSFLGADLILSSPRKPKPAYLKQAKENKLKTSQAIAFSTALMANDEFMLAHVKSTDNNYPLLGQIEIKNDVQRQKVSYGPKQGEIWLGDQILKQLKLTLGDTIEVGYLPLKITAQLIHDPGQVNSFLSFAPKGLMHIDDIDKTGIIQPGSRVSWQTAFSGDKPSITNYQQWLKTQLHSSEKLIGGTNQNTAVNKALIKTRSLLSLSNILSLVLSGIAIAMCTRLFLQRHEKQIAIMRCLGASQNKILSYFLIELLLLAIPTSLIALLFGYFLESTLVTQLSNLLPHRVLNIELLGILKALTTAFISGLLTVLLFSIPAFYKLLQMPANHIFRQSHTAKTEQTLALLGISFCYLFLLSSWQTGQWTLSLLISAGLLAILIAFFVLAMLILRLSRYLRYFVHGAKKLGLQQFSAHYRTNSYLIFSISLSIMMVLAFIQIKSTLIKQWENKLSDQTPNYFVINISETELSSMQDFFKKHHLISQGLFPVVRGRIEKINNEAIAVRYPDPEQRDNSLRRDLNLSWHKQLPASNRLISGQWHGKTDNNKLTVSIEQGVAKRLGLKLNDKLELSIADKMISAQITSIRSLEWDSFQPNFYLIFSPGDLNNFSPTYMSSFYLKQGNASIIVELLQNFPAATVLDLNSLIRQIQSTLNQLVILLQYLFVFLLASSLFVILSSLLSSHDERSKSKKLMTILGAKSSFISRCQSYEYMGIIIATLIMAGFGSIILNIILDYYFFNR
ncbi:MAG: hypothetical protein HQL46_14530 [Gammaproteobacteria bacterium]|nr:hypothetical protein [Gammaproteobacteria bacterium]